MEKLNFNEAWELIYLLNEVVNSSTYNEDINLYTLSENHNIVFNNEAWTDINNVLNKLVNEYNIKGLF